MSTKPVMLLVNLIFTQLMSFAAYRSQIIVLEEFFV